MKKQNEEFICAYCEWASLKEDGAFFCRKKKTEVEMDGICRSFSYDLLKRSVAPKPTIPVIDPALFE